LKDTIKENKRESPHASYEQAGPLLNFC